MNKSQTLEELKDELKDEFAPSRNTLSGGNVDGFKAFHLTDPNIFFITCFSNNERTAEITFGKESAIYLKEKIDIFLKEFN